MSLNFILAGFFGSTAVILGAISAHAGLSEYAQNLTDKAVQYQLFHALVILALARFHSKNSKILLTATALFSLGILLFCGSLYSLGFSNERLFSNSAPLGGSCLILGWFSLLVYGVKRGLQQVPSA